MGSCNGAYTMFVHSKRLGMDVDIGRVDMRILILAATIGAVALPASAASAQYWGGGNRVRQEQRECQRELRHANNRWQYERELRECRREISQARRHDYRRYNDNGYYGDRYDRDRYGYRGR
jgi:hypothetical protein